MSRIKVALSFVLSTICTGILMTISLTACGPTKSEVEANPEKYETPKVIDFGYSSDGYQIIKIGDCEYIKGWAGVGNGGPFLTHKGDCSNPNHVYNYYPKTETK
jgi:hypothetical protein